MPFCWEAVGGGGSGGCDGGAIAGPLGIEVGGGGPIPGGR